MREQFREVKPFMRSMPYAGWYRKAQAEGDASLVSGIDISQLLHNVRINLEQFKQVRVFQKDYRITLDMSRWELGIKSDTGEAEIAGYFDVFPDAVQAVQRDVENRYHYLSSLSPRPKPEESSDDYTLLDQILHDAHFELDEVGSVQIPSLHMKLETYLDPNVDDRNLFVVEVHSLQIPSAFPMNRYVFGTQESAKQFVTDVITREYYRLYPDLKPKSTLPSKPSEPREPHKPYEGTSLSDLFASKREDDEVDGVSLSSKWTPVKSSFITEIRYAELAGKLDVKLKNGRVYTFDIPIEVFEAFQVAPSKGRFFNEVILSQYAGNFKVFTKEGKKTNWYRTAMAKKLYVMRGLSGSGKSSLAEEIGRGGEVFSTDDFFMINGKYQFDHEMLSYAHLWNQAHAIDAMKRGVSPIVIDNVNSRAWEAKQYVEAGLKYGYRVEIVEPDTPWKFDAEELAKRNKHGVPKEVIEKKIQEWEPNITVGDILRSQRPEEIKTISGANWYQMYKVATDIETGSVEQYLKGMVQIRSGMNKPEGFHYSCPEDFTLQNGRHYSSSPLTEAEAGILKKLAKTTCRYRMKECFYNAQHLATTDSRIKYVEGYLYSGIIPLEHGWNTINGKVIDFTMYHKNNGKPILGVIPDGWDYFGVEMSSGSVRKYWADHGMSEPLITNWREEYPLLKKKFEQEQEDELV